MTNAITPTAQYKRQLEAGFDGLRFGRALEAEFVADFRKRRMHFTRTGLILAAAFYSIYSLAKLVFDEPNFYLYWGTGLRLAIIATMLITARWVSRVPGKQRDKWIISNYCIFALMLIGIEVITVRQGQPQHYEGMIFVIFHACLFGGLLLRPCLATILLMASCYLGFGALFGIPPAALGYQAFFLLLASIMGIVGLYLTEHAERDNFLRRHLMHVSANFDELTGLASRSAFDHKLKTHLRQAAGTTPTPQAIVLVDLDHFKQLNDCRGHDSGDKCLQLVADVLKRGIDGPPEMVGRWGGDELIAALPAPDEEALLRCVEGIRAEVEQLHMKNPDSPRGELTISIGVLIVQPEQRLEEKMLFRQTDGALYQAKQQGRNQVVMRHARAEAFSQTIPAHVEPKTVA